MYEIKTKQDGTVNILLDGKSIDDMSLNSIKHFLCVAYPVINNLQQDHLTFIKYKHLLTTIHSNVNNKFLSDQEFRNFVRNTLS